MTFLARLVFPVLMQSLNNNHADAYPPVAIDSRRSLASRE
jgi:hypothetical protein